jgi:hypothetical protein
MRVLLSFCLSVLFPFILMGQALDSTNLPLVVINTNGQSIPDGNKISANMKIISNGPGLKNRPGDPGNVYSGPIGIEIRGAYSSSLPQKPYGFETRDALGGNLNVPLLGMPAENDWILHANYNDKSFVRNPMSFQLFRELGHYASRTAVCEVLVNGSYQGIYNLTEKIKIDKNRLDVKKLDLDDNAGDSITGGYVFTIDYYDWNNSWQGQYSPLGYPNNPVYFVYNFPKPAEITAQQKLYIQTWVKNFEANLYSVNFQNPTIGYRKYMDVTSFIDYFILSEISRNADGYKKSCFYNKKKDSDGGLLAAGPVWDFDWAWKDIWDCSIFSQTDGSGWAYKVLECNVWPTPTGWIPRLMDDPRFVSELKYRYSSLRQTTLSNKRLLHYIDSVNTIIADAQVRHYKKWPILGQNVGAPEVGAIPSTYPGETYKFKSWINSRLRWLDEQLLIDITDVPVAEFAEVLIRIYPNPASDVIYIDNSNHAESLSIFSYTGEEIYNRSNLENSLIQLNVCSFKRGIYIVRLTMPEGNIVTGKFILE